MKRFFLLTVLVACGGSTAPSPTPAAEPVCTTLGAEVEVIDDGASMYPPYAVAGCRLAYVQRSTRRLVVRDLRTGTEEWVTETPASAADLPRRPTLGRDFVAWEVGAGSATSVRVFRGGTTTTLTGDFEHAGEPRAAGDAVAFTGWKFADANGDTDVFLHLVATGETLAVATGPAQQRFADASNGYVAYTDFSEDPDGRYDMNDTDLADIGVYDRTTRATVTRKNPGKDAFPVLTDGDRFGYLHWGDVHPEPKFQAFGVRSGRVGSLAATDVALADVTNAFRFTMPTGKSGAIEWIAPDTTGVERLYRAPADGTATAKPILDGGFLFAPQSSAGMTVAAVSNAGTMTLRYVAR